MTDMKIKALAPNKNILKRLIERSPKADLDKFLATFTGFVFQGSKGFSLARKYIREEKGECVVIFHSWWVILRTGADWMNCLKLRQYMNDWNGEDNIFLGEYVNGKLND